MTVDRRTIAGYARLARISNLPTCVTNALVGVAAGTTRGPLDGTVMLAMIAAVSLLYVAGMGLNDLLDAEIDRTERPHRPIPSGVVTRRGAAWFTGICLMLGVGTIAWLGFGALVFGLALAGCIVLYDVVHHRTSASVLLMGACRALVYLTAAAAASSPGLHIATAAWLAGAMGGYVTLLSVVARVEASGGLSAARFSAACLLPIVALSPALAIRPAMSGAALAGGALVVAWLVLSLRHLRSKPPRIGLAVMAWLAGICLIDGYFLLLLDRPLPGLIAAGCFVLTILGHRRIAGT